MAIELIVGVAFESVRIIENLSDFFIYIKVDTSEA